MIDHPILRKLFVAFMVISITATYIPSLSFAASEDPAETPAVTTAVSVKGADDGNKITVTGEEGETKVTKDADVTGEELKVKYEVSEDSELQITVKNAEVKSVKNIKKVKDNTYEATDKSGSFELVAASGSKMNAEFTETEAPAEAEGEKAGSTDSKDDKDAASSDDEESDPKTPEAEKENKGTEETVQAEEPEVKEETADTKTADETEAAGPEIEVKNFKMMKGLQKSANANGTGSLTPGTNLSYTHEGFPKETFHVGDFVGKCCQSGLPAKNKGTASVDAMISNDSTVAKLAYYYTYVDNILNKTSKPSSDAYEHIGATWAQIFGRAIGYVDMGRTAWRKNMEAQYDNKSTVDTYENTIKDMIAKTANVQVPAGFEIYRMNEPSSDHQDFMIWKYNPYGYVYIQKTAANTAVNFIGEAPNNYTIQGAVYGLYTDAACMVPAKNSSGANVVLTTGANGATPVAEVEQGTYFAKEVTASKGFRINSAIYPVTVTADNTAANPAKISSIEDPTYSTFNLSLIKQSKEGNYGYKRLLGAEYEIKYYDIDLGYGDTTPTEETVAGKAPKKTWKFVTREGTDENGLKVAMIDFANDEPISGGSMYKMGGSAIMPNGVFTIQEVTPPTGLANDPTVHVGKVQQPANGQASKAGIDGNDTLHVTYGEDRFDTVNDEPEKTIKIRLQKVDAKTGQPVASAADREFVPGSLKGAIYEVYKEDPEYSEDIKVGEIVTDENGYGELEKDANEEDLRAGRYFIKETKASDGYVVDSATTKEEKDKYEDGRHIVLARYSEEADKVVYEYEIRSEDPPHETHVYKTDLTTGEELPGATLQVLDSEGNIVEEWVSTDEPHDILALHDETQGKLKDGKYTLREITAPYGYDTAEDVEFEVKSGEVENKVKMENAPINIRTTASDELTKSHAGTFSKEEKIKDIVKFENLYAGREYTFEGTLMDKATAQPMLDKDGNKITAEKTCTFDENGKIIEGEYTGPKGVLISGEVEIEFTVDASEFTKEKVAVAAEKIFRERRELAMHADLKDEDQSIHYGGIAETTAVDKDSKTHNVMAGQNVTIVDTVAYKNLAVGETYVLQGELYDKTTGKLTGIKSEKKSFTPETSDGTVDVLFKFDASNMKNHDLVAYEVLTINDIELDRHEDPNDENQTVQVPDVKTTLTDTKTNDHIAHGTETVTVKDTVLYSNLIPGKEYEMTGTLMDKTTGRPLASNGAVVTATTKFTAPAKNGSVELTFTFDGSALRGHTVVAYETCKVNGVPIAIHADLNDKDQSVNIPKIGTEANLAKAHKEVFDLVSYENLKPGKYVMRGWLMDKKTGKKVADSEGETEFTVPENGPFAGAVTVDLPIENYGKLGGHKLVAYEELYYVVPGTNGQPEREEIVADHKDLKDRAQTVTIPGGKPKTGDDHALFLFGGVFGLSAALYLVLRKRQQIQDR